MAIEVLTTQGISTLLCISRGFGKKQSSMQWPIAAVPASVRGHLKVMAGNAHLVDHALDPIHPRNSAALPRATAANKTPLLCAGVSLPVL